MITESINFKFDNEDQQKRFHAVLETKPHERIASLEAALRLARPYVQAFADNAPADDGGAQAIADLEAIDGAVRPQEGAP